MFELKKYRRVIFHDAREWCKIWSKNDLWFGKWQEEFGKFSLEHTKISKLGLLLGSFIQSRKCMCLKFTRVLCVMTMKNYTKFEKKLTCLFKMDMRNLANFHLSTRIYLENLHFNGLLLTKVFNVWVKKSTEKLYLMTLNIGVKFEGKLTCAF